LTANRCPPQCDRNTASCPQVGSNANRHALDDSVHTGTSSTEDTRTNTTDRPDTSPTDTSTTIVPHGQTASGHRHPIFPQPAVVWGYTPNDPAHSANITHPVKHTFDHRQLQSHEQLRTLLHVRVDE
jgi:hypothetical protein